MGFRSFLSKPFAAYVVKKQNEWANNPGRAQQNVFNSLIQGAGNTAFGKDHNFGDIKNYEDFKKHVPICDYEELRPYINRIIQGESDVLWKESLNTLQKLQVQLQEQNTSR